MSLWNALNCQNKINNGHAVDAITLKSNIFVFLCNIIIELHNKKHKRLQQRQLYKLCALIYIYIYICICYVMPRVLYQVYNHRARGPQARGCGDYKPDIARVGMT